MTFNPDVRGPDVSFYQDDDTTPAQIDFNKMKSAGASFVIIRAGQRTWPDEDFKYNYQAAKDAGLPRGVYWFYDSRVSPMAQATLLLSLVGYDFPEIGVWGDFEEYYGGTYKGWRNWKTFLELLQSKLPRVGIYTAPSYWDENRPFGNDDLAYFKNFPLWIANYNVSSPRIPLPWETAVFWQIGTPNIGPQYGCESKEIDMNYFNGDYEDFVTMFSGDVIPPAGDNTMQYKVVWSQGCSKRILPSTSGSSVGVLPSGAIVEVLQDNIADSTYPADVNKRWVKLSDGYYAASNYPDGTGPKERMTKIVEVPPADNITVSIDVTITETINDVQYSGVGHLDNITLNPG